MLLISSKLLVFHSYCREHVDMSVLYVLSRMSVNVDACNLFVRMLIY